LWKEVRFKREVVNTKDVFITTNVETNGLNAQNMTISSPKYCIVDRCHKVMRKRQFVSIYKVLK
jgi:hypothetical protein